MNKLNSESIDSAHPNFQLWTRYHQSGAERGKLVDNILSSRTEIRNKRILDLGCGYGGIAKVLSEAGAEVTAVEVEIGKLAGINQKKAAPLLMSGTELGFRKDSFNIVILQDVIEHVVEQEKLLAEITRVLQPGGLLYVVTPNRLSPLNWVADPHWNLPFVALASRKWVKFLIWNVFRREKKERPDFAALLSWFQLKRLLTQHRLKLNFVNSVVVQTLFSNPIAVVCHPLHLKIVAWIRKSHLQSVIEKCVSDKPGVFNSFINPTWYLLCENEGQ